MSRINIFAYTPAMLSPPYLSVNREEDGSVSFHVRSAAPAGQVYGSEASITLTAEQFHSFVRQVWLAECQQAGA